MVFVLSIFFISLLVFPLISLYIDQILKNKFQLTEISVDYYESMTLIFRYRQQQIIFFLLEGALFLWIFAFLTNSIGKVSITDTIRVTDQIEIPVAVGQGQHGTSRFLTEDEMKKVYTQVVYNPKNPKPLKGNYGLVLGMTKEGKKEIITCIMDDINVIMVGSTRSGKSRGEILQTIFLRALTGKSMVITDAKGELYLYTMKYLKKKGYNVLTFDLRNPLKSMRYNFLQQIIDAVQEDNIPKAIDYTWDFVSVLVGVPKGEPLWTNGQAATIAAAILTLVLEAPKEFQNLTNVYYFLSNMCKYDEEGRMFITKYFEKLPDTHPARGVFDVAEISPEKMRGSFFGMALTTLRHFTNWNLADMTSESEFDVGTLGMEKTALFIIVPDEKSTLYPIVSVMMNQIYVKQVEIAMKHGGRLPIEVDFLADEFGNFPTIPSFGSMISAGLSRGIRFYLVIQDFQQLEKHYKEDYANIKGNCVVWVYLKTTDPKTLEEFSKKTGTYTIQVNSVSNSSSGKYNNNYSSSANMQSRTLLLPDEVGRINRPYTLIINSGYFPAVMYTPDLSEYKANELFGLGDKEHNKKVIMERENERKERQAATLNLWGIWNEYKNSNDEKKDDSNNEHKKERISFLNLGGNYE